MSASFLNVDLEIESPVPLDYLMLQLANYEIYHLYCGELNGGYLATFESNQPSTLSPDTLINILIQAIERVDQQARLLWDQADRKTFDIGYSTSATPGNYHAEIQPETIAAIAQVGASLAITLYPCSENSKMDQ